MTIQKENHDKFHRQEADSFHPKTGYIFSAPLIGFFRDKESSVPLGFNIFLQTLAQHSSQIQ